MLKIISESSDPVLDELLETAGEATSPPPEPQGGIPANGSLRGSGGPCASSFSPLFSWIWQPKSSPGS